MAKSWRDRLAPIIAQVLSECQGLSLHETRKRLREAFPCGERKNHPYKIWLSECAFQLGLKHRTRSLRRNHIPGPGQRDLFTEQDM